MNQFEIINKLDIKIEETLEVEKLLNYALDYLKIDNAIFNVIITDEEEIRYLNKTYRSNDSVTDVISFALEDDKTFKNPTFRILGDIYICNKRALEQAKNYGHSYLRELSFLTIHGLLHLLGYDHMKPEDEKIMFSLQEEILDSYGIKR